MIHAVFRADAGPALGIGHVMRCLALGTELRRRGGSALLLGACDAALGEKLRSSGFETRTVEQPHPSDQDLRRTLETLDDLKATGRSSWLVLDGYHFDPGYQAAVRRHGHRLLVIDDTAHLSHYHADVLLNQNANAADLDYRCDPDTRRLLGVRYGLLRPEFARWRGWERPTPPIARRILVTMGGGDAVDVTLKVLDGLRCLDRDTPEVTVVVGSVNPRAPILADVASGLPFEVRLISSPADMSQLMAAADLAVSAAGSTAWELAFMGLPAILLPLADNQLALADSLARCGVVERLDAAASPEAIGAVASGLVRDPERRAAMSRAGRALVDAEGPRRVTREMAATAELERFDVRRAEPGDAEAIWRINNDPGVRASSFNPEPIPLERHLEWYGRKLATPHARMWVLVREGSIAAVVRYDRGEPESAEIGIAVAEPYRGRSLGTRALLATWQLACDELDVARVRGVVIDTNTASTEAFLKAGFTRARRTVVAGRSCIVFERVRDGGQ